MKKSIIFNLVDSPEFSHPRVEWETVDVYTASSLIGNNGEIAGYTYDISIIQTDNDDLIVSTFAEALSPYRDAYEQDIADGAKIPSWDDMLSLPRRNEVEPYKQGPVS